VTPRPGYGGLQTARRSKIFEPLRRPAKKVRRGVGKGTCSGRSTLRRKELVDVIQKAAIQKAAQKARKK
jgi:hypothetical protein